MGHGSTPANSRSTFLRHVASPLATAPFWCRKMAPTARRHLRARASETPARAPVSSSAATSGYAFGSRTLSSTAASSRLYVAEISRAPRETRTVSSPAESARCSPKAKPENAPVAARSTASNSRSRRNGEIAVAVFDASARATDASFRSENHVRVSAGSAERHARYAPSASRSRSARRRRAFEKGLRREDETNVVSSSPLRSQNRNDGESASAVAAAAAAPAPPAPFLPASRAARAASRHTRGNASMETDPTLFVLSAFEA